MRRRSFLALILAPFVARSLPAPAAPHELIARIRRVLGESPHCLGYDEISPGIFVIAWDDGRVVIRDASNLPEIADQELRAIIQQIQRTLAETTFKVLNDARPPV